MKPFYLLSFLFISVNSNILEASNAQKQAEAFFADYIVPNKIPEPDHNIGTPEKIQLGKTLFFDPRISNSGITSCASCHNPSFSWGDGMPLGKGDKHQTLERRTPTIINSAWTDLHFWDGRSDSLEEQSLMPITSEVEMNMSIDDMVLTLRKINGYHPLFEKAYPGEGITSQTVAKALAAFERTIVSNESQFDKWISGEKDAITEKAKNGFILFNTKAQCTLCHSGWNFTDGSFHDIGVVTKDKGRGPVLEIDSVDFHFKTPTLRNIVERAPYMHNGSEKTLHQVMELYNKGGRVQRDTLSGNIKPLNLIALPKSMTLYTFYKL